MKNNSVILINGFTRGGTNILWNIVQSHPQVCSPVYETGEIFRTRWPLRFLRGAHTVSPTLHRVLKKRLFDAPPFRKRVHTWIDEKLYRLKLETLQLEDAKFKDETTAYTDQEVFESVLCMKSVDYEIWLTELLCDCFPQTFVLGLVRDGYALCNGWMRRGSSAKRAGRKYRLIAERLIAQSEQHPNFLLLRFEDVLADPFGTASRVFEFAQLTPTRLDKLRLKAKKVTQRGDKYGVKFGELNRKYWFDQDAIGEVLQSDVSQVQSDRLSQADREAFRAEALPALKHFGYAS